MRLEDMREQFPKMPESMKRMIEQEVAVQIGQEKENDNPKVVTYKKRKKKNMAPRSAPCALAAATAARCRRKASHYRSASRLPMCIFFMLRPSIIY